ncbi:hypothetical protein KIF53_09425 [Chromobacterium subtsugae]|uniref:AbrB family transcriptional regulator n=1 Tax=Chromobacterium subtsugae TaxID=251747 RepID=A0ABS7FCM1_9NEIS|nr:MULTISPECIES: hypothetical protein [Chromobacterium]MBW7566298.1 hypothetical protein [Chromobacterium subtsugae]MBW8287843.1 hypothetical protein [Chromobacterium subtsugae]WSE91172.1 hypothetical protein U6115_20210 [Chromobacterium subtsugae]WVH59547.1 hypothetical protein U6151_20240 [Chromobacterium subtsugae]
MSKVKGQVVSLPVVFKDLVFKSRTLVMPSGEVLSVSGGQAVAMTDEALQFLTDHADFESVAVPVG